MSVCVCVCVRERERERVSEGVLVKNGKGEWNWITQKLQRYGPLWRGQHSDHSILLLYSGHW